MRRVSDEFIWGDGYKRFGVEGGEGSGRGGGLEHGERGNDEDVGRRADRRQHVLFSEASGGSFGSQLLGFGGSATAGGVEVAGVVEDQGAPLMRFDPGHPDAGADGYVAYPDINPLTEMVDLMGATRAYGMNASAVQAEKSMLSSSLELLK